MMILKICNNHHDFDVRYREKLMNELMPLHSQMQLHKSKERKHRRNLWLVIFAGMFVLTAILNTIPSAMKALLSTRLDIESIVSFCIVVGGGYLLFKISKAFVHQAVHCSEAQSTYEKLRLEYEAQHPEHGALSYQSSGQLTEMTDEKKL